MKTSVERVFRGATFGFALSVVFSGATYKAQAQRLSRGPVISPAIINAHRLKYYPPRGWIRHYLGDDRYKLGTIWKVVTTPNDKFYYPPFAAEMLRRSPNDVIGFASTQDAEEAGYKPASNYNTAFALDIHQLAQDDARDNPAPAGNSSETVINNSKKAQRIVLADGVSTVDLPPNWKRTRSLVKAFYGNTKQKSDRLQSLSGGGILEFSSFELPVGMAGNVAKLTNPKGLQQLLTRVGQNNVSVRSAAMGGLSGSVVTPKAGTRFSKDLTEFGEKAIIVARGSKSYTLAYFGNRNVAGASAIINSFRPR